MLLNVIFIALVCTNYSFTLYELERLYAEDGFVEFVLTRALVCGNSDSFS